MTQPLGRYHLGDTLGGGPIGEVFRAKVYGVAGFERQFAVKRVHAALAGDATAADLLGAAARSYATIEHPRVARLHELGTASGSMFFAVELVQGLDVARLVSGTFGNGEPLPLGGAVGLLAQAARAVAFGHQRGVLHLGICPTNIIVTSDGDVKVCDFGLLRARLRGEPAGDPSLAARLPYLAPEQVRPKDATAATDVFQLAALGYELITGERAFSGRTPAEIAQRIAEVLPPDPPVPAPLCDVLRRAFTAKPADRFPHAGAFADALDAAIRQAPLPGGRSDIAAAVRRTTMRLKENSAQNVSGAVTFPLPAPPPSVPGVALSSLFPDGKLPRALGGPATALATTFPPGEPKPSTTLTGYVPPPNVLPHLGESSLRTPLGDTLPVSKLEPSDIEAETIELPAPDPETGDVTVDLSGSESYPPKEWRDTLQDQPSPMRPPPIPSAARQTAPPPIPTLAVAIVPPPTPRAPSVVPPIPPPLRAGANGQEKERDPRPSGAVLVPPPALVPPPSTTMPPGVAPMPPPGVAPRPPAAVPPEVKPTEVETVRTPRASVRTRTPQFEGVAPTGKTRGGIGKWIVLLVVLGGLGTGAYFGYGWYLGQQAKPAAPVVATKPKPPETKPIVTPVPAPDARPAEVKPAGVTPDAAPVAIATPVATPPDAAPVPPDAAVAEATPPDAHVAALPSPPDAAVAAKPVAETPPRPPADPTPADGPLEIVTSPRGAAVYLDGALKGNSPLTLPATGDKHKLVVLLRGHKMHRAEVRGSGKISVELEEAPSRRGPAGIKVKCQSRNRLYIIVDGEHTGELCPSERIPVSLGMHTVEVYDPVSDATFTHQADVKDTHFSYRFFVEN